METTDGLRAGTVSDGDTGSLGSLTWSDHLPRHRPQQQMRHMQKQQRRYDRGTVSSFRSRGGGGGGGTSDTASTVSTVESIESVDANQALTIIGPEYEYAGIDNERGTESQTYLSSYSRAHRLPVQLEGCDDGNNFTEYPAFDASMGRDGTEKLQNLWHRALDATTKDYSGGNEKNTKYQVEEKARGTSGRFSRAMSRHSSHNSQKSSTYGSDDSTIISAQTTVYLRYLYISVVYQRCMHAVSI